MYEYKIVQSHTSGLVVKSNHGELIEKYSKEGWRFVEAIATVFNNNGRVEMYDLVFERKID